MTLKIIPSGDEAKVYTPYNSAFVRRVKNIGGARWDGEYWIIPAHAVGICRQYMRDIYGRCDLKSEAGKSLRLKVTFKEDKEEWHDDVILFGKTVCHAWDRDSGGRAGDDVAYIKGRPSSGGSKKNWTSAVLAGTEVILADVPEKLYREYLQSGDDLGISVELVDIETAGDSGRVDPADIASHIIGLMSEQGLTKEALAERLGTTRQNVHRILSGKDFKASTLDDFAHALGYALKIEFVPII
jgi:hypothetical protein